MMLPSPWWKLPDRPVPGSDGKGSFDSDAVRDANGIFAQDDNAIGTLEIPSPQSQEFRRTRKAGQLASMHQWAASFELKI